MYYVATANAVVERHLGRQQPPDKIQHGIRLQDVLYNLANELADVTHTDDGVPIAKWHIEVKVSGISRARTPIGPPPLPMNR